MNDLKGLAKAFDNLKLGIASFGFTLVKEAQKQEQLINEIGVLTNMTKEEVKLFYQTHNYDLEFLRLAVTYSGNLDEWDMQQSLVVRFGHYLNSEKFSPLDWQTKLKDKLSDIPYYTAYYITYCFMWLAYWFKDGFMSAKEDIWE